MGLVEADTDRGINHEDVPQHLAWRMTKTVAPEHIQSDRGLETTAAIVQAGSRKGSIHRVGVASHVHGSVVLVPVLIRHTRSR